MVADTHRHGSASSWSAYSIYSKLSGGSFYLHSVLMTEPYVFKHPAKRFAAKTLDALGSWVRSSLFRPVKAFDRSQVKKILLIRLDHLGDAIMVRPAIDAVLSHFPEATVDFLVAAENAPLFAHEPRLNLIPMTHHWFSRRSNWLDKMTEMEKLVPILRREHYDLGIDFRGDLRNILLMTFAGIPERVGYGITGGGFLLTRQEPYDSSLHQTSLNMKLLNSLGIDEKPSARAFSYPAEKKSSFKENAARPFRVIIHPGAGYASKRWPAENFRSLIEKILATYSFAHVVLIGTREDQQLFPILEQEGAITDLRGKTKIEDLPALFDTARLYIGNDSGPAHLAAFQNLPGIIIFSGTNQPALWQPWSEKFQIIRHEVPCSPCEAQQCPLTHHDCLQKISVDQVLAAAADLISHETSNRA